ncbi:MAG TPA: lipoprotein insertase outer membrane protein LolB [Steroidobacteraceae bacterium]
MRSRLLRIGAAAVLCALAGCRTATVFFPVVAPWEVRRPQLQAREHFDLRGRVAVATGQEGFNANLHWAQEGVRSLLTLEGPLGAGGVQISASGNELDIVTARGAHVNSAAAHAELATRLGFDPPLPSLRYWILGVPDPAQPATEEFDERQQRLQGLTQAGWHIAYNLYVAVGADWLPARLTLQRDAVRVRLLVDDWQL